MAHQKWRWVAPICALVVCGAGLMADVARAFCLEPAPRIQTEVFRSDIVVVGTVAAERRILNADHDIVGWCYSVQVHDWLRGSGKDIVRLCTDNMSSRLPLTLHGEYLLFAKRRGHELVISGCGNSTEIAAHDSAVREVRRVIEAARRSNPGDIRGRVVKHGARSVGVAGISFIARRGRAEYRATSDADGWFHFLVPAGTYSVGPGHGSTRIVAYELSYDPPRRVVVRGGGGGEVQFLADAE